MQIFLPVSFYIHCRFFYACNFCPCSKLRANLAYLFCLGISIFIICTNFKISNSSFTSLNIFITPISFLIFLFILSFPLNFQSLLISIIRDLFNFTVQRYDAFFYPPNFFAIIFVIDHIIILNYCLFFIIYRAIGRVIYLVSVFYK